MCGTAAVYPILVRLEHLFAVHALFNSRAFPVGPHEEFIRCMCVVEQPSMKCWTEWRLLRCIFRMTTIYWGDGQKGNIRCIWAV